MPTIYRKEATRISIAEAKRLIIDNTPAEATAEIYAHFTPEGELDLDAPISVVEAVGKPHAHYLDEEFKSLCAKLGIKPTMRWRPSVEGYPETKSMDGEYTISHDEFSEIANSYCLAVVIGAEQPSTDGIKEVTTIAKPKLRVQEERILELLKEHGYQPTALPLPPSGLAGPKAEVKKAALKEPKLFTSNTFDKAWERLRGMDEIADTK